MATTDSDAARPNVLIKTRKYLLLVVEISGLWIVIGGILSIIINEELFSHWGISFLSLASPSDILLSGLKWLGLLVNISLYFGAGLLFGHLILFWFRSRFGGVTSVVVFGGILSVISLLAFVKISWLEGLIYVPVFCLGCVLSLWRWLAKSSPPVHWGAHSWLAFVSAVMIGIAIIVEREEISTIAKEQLRAYTFVMDEVPGCPTARVLWMGAESVVAHCAIAGRARYVILDRSGLTLATEYPAQPDGIFPADSARELKPDSSGR